MKSRTTDELIIRKGNQYLVCYSKITGDLKWSMYKYDAWRTPRMEDAEKVVKATGGEILHFNRFTGQETAIN